MRALFLLLLLVSPPAFADKTCVDCHASAAKRSYALSKHGVIARIEAGRTRQRAPDCGGCHTFETVAPAPKHHSGDKERTEARQQASAGCGNCHSPRYATEQLAAARRGLEIGEMKWREADALVAVARKELKGEELIQAEKLLANMRDENLRDLRLGLAHQSPDYQWWLGQAALDGSLLRIKSVLGEAIRARANDRTAERR